MMPRTFEEWQHCIVHDCKIKLTKSFAESRLLVFQNRKHPETIRFIELYGEQYLNNVIHWYQKIAA